MANIADTLNTVSKIDGVMGSAIGDWNTGFSLGQRSSDPNFSELKLEQAIAVNAEVIKAKNRSRETLGIKAKIEDILITLEDQYHLIRLSEVAQGVFFYLVLNREKSNLGLARIKLREAEQTLQI
jgi:predicted regulator of Ras-like GTPase activity (Roadblock/LC7/MglB family)